MQATVQYNQTLLDISIQEYGTMETLFDLAASLNKSITTELVAGEVLVIPQKITGAKERSISYLLKKIENTPACGDNDIAYVDGGIGFMQIGSSFKVS